MHNVKLYTQKKLQKKSLGLMFLMTFHRYQKSFIMKLYRNDCDRCIKVLTLRSFRERSARLRVLRKI